MKKKSFNESMDDISKKIKKIFDSIDEEEHSSLAEYIAFEATVNGAYNTYEGVGILDVAKRNYLKVCEEVDNEDNNPQMRIVNLN